MLFIISKQVLKAAQQHEEAAQDQTHAAIARASAQQKAEMIQELHTIEQTVEQNVSEHHLHMLTHMNRVAERSMRRTQNKPSHGGCCPAVTGT